MPVDRPTFHESWYRVASLRPRLRSTVQSYRQYFRGRRWHVLRDEATNKFFRLDDANHHFVGLLDGRRTVGEAWAAACERLGDAAPTQGEAIQLLGQLYTSNLLEADLPGDAEGLLRRRRKRVAREVRQYVTNILFAKIPLFDPDRLLDRVTPFCSWCFSPVGVVLWLVLLGLGFNALAGRWSQLFSQASGVLAPDNLIYLYAASVVIKLVHELGHGVACKRFGQQPPASGGGGGGEVHTFGVMLLVFIPLPYVDASSAWGMRSKWKRATVGAAGMYAELALAALAAMLWARSAAGTTLHALAFNAVFTAGVSTILFNANPLIRFDGYYILSDLLEFPNLAQRAKEKLHYLVKRYAYGVRRPHNPSPRLRESTGLVIYGLLAMVYRVWLSVSILLFVADKLFFLGTLMAVVSLVGWVLTPLGKFLHYLATSPELYKTRRRAILATAVPLGLLLLLGLWPVTEHGRAEGIVDPRKMVKVHAEVDGFVQHTLASGATVQPDGDPLLVAENMELATRVRRGEAQLAILQTRRRMALAEEPAQAQALAEQIAVVRDELAHARRELAMLTVHAPFAGTWLCGDADRVHGRYVKRGEELGVVATLDELTLRMTADQFVGPRLASELSPGDRVNLRVKGRPDLKTHGVVTRVLQGGRRTLPPEALGFAGGGNLPVAQPTADHQGNDQAAEPFFEVWVRLERDPGGEEAPPLFCGQRVVARFALPPAPLLAQGWRSVRQLLQERFHI